MGSVAKFQGNQAENISFLAVIVCLIILTVVSVYKLVCSRMRNFGFGINKTGTKAPSFFEALRLADLEEMIEEEKAYIYELNTQNMTVENLDIADRIL